MAVGDVCLPPATAVEEEEKEETSLPPVVEEEEEEETSLPPAVAFKCWWKAAKQGLSWR